jgi:FlaA1/EpsC-like NDP-sugar epimerase
MARGGEVFITKMPVVRIADLARAMTEELAPKYGFDAGKIETKIIGTKPGEKLYEELMSSEETRRAVELDKYFAVLPAFRGIYQDIAYDYPGASSEPVNNPYVSADRRPLSVAEIRTFLRQNGLLAKPAEKTKTRYWPGDKEEN